MSEEPEYIKELKQLILKLKLLGFKEEAAFKTVYKLTLHGTTIAVSTEEGDTCTKVVSDGLNFGGVYFTGYSRFVTVTNVIPIVSRLIANINHRYENLSRGMSFEPSVG